MSKGNRVRENRRTIAVHTSPTPSACFGFSLPDTPDNRNLVAMLTGHNAAKYATGTGLLESEQAQKNSGSATN